MTTIPIIDLRPAEIFQQGHLPGAIHLAFEQLAALWHELPPKGTTVILCADDPYASDALALFTDRQFVVDTLYSTDQLSQFSLASGPSQERVWHGNPILEEHAALITPNTPNPAAIDVGCGSGRDAILLGLMGYHVYAIDLFEQALERAEHSATRWGVTLSRVHMDCRKDPDELIALIKKTQPQLIMQSRFLHRPLFDIYQQYLPRGCKLVIHTFLEGAAKFGKPKKPDFLLKNDELSERFGHWSVLLDQVHHLDDGRPLSLFIAEKR
ncbi:rhodanese-like domain-containing protein [Kangiella marina]|uniref:Rhodanese domain-containing protein n=1 Tax=Kangiella marina TaxID=1079178 RepID=A0ABP8IIE4_9GAMM